jgi:acyl-homoserine lactone acylase PvdQ
MKSDSKEALIYNVFEKHLVENLNYNIVNMINSKLNISEEIKQNVKKNIMYYMSRENYLLYKIKSYRENPYLCVKDYKKNCFEFYLSIINITFEYIEANLSLNEKYWKWGNLTKKEYAHKPFSMVNYLNILAHRVIENDIDGNSRTPKVNYHRITMDFESVVSSNVKFLVTTKNEKMEFFASTDMGQSGKLFHRFYDNLMLKHEKGILNFIDSYNKKNREFTLFFNKE